MDIKMRTNELKSLINESINNFLQQTELFTHVFKTEKYKSTSFSETLRLLNMYLCDRGKGVITLVDANLGWDAEILLRSYYECSSKILYFCTSTTENENQYLEEFWGDMEEISARRTSDKAKFAKNVFSLDRQSERDVFEALESAKFRDIGRNTPKSVRRKIEQKWSFTEIIQYLDNNTTPNNTLKGAKSLLHIYGMASHLIHADASALRLMIDRASRTESEHLFLSEGHFSRILTDVASIGFLSLRLSQNRLGVKTAKPDAAYKSYSNVLEKSRIIQDKFNESQKDFYDDFLGRK